ncbi:hypothetical protein AC249_AIPGENE17438 [Exaiptasia diaphana]|nr:hypothetical protein AC249_AIPGENE17438 [Exaiptasia diaphana]
MIREKYGKSEISASEHRVSLNEVVTRSDRRLIIGESFKRRQHELKKARKKIKSLEERLETSKLKRDRLRQKLKRSQTTNRTPPNANEEEMTPRTRTEVQIRNAGLTPKKVPSQLRKRLAFSNVLSDEIRQSQEKNKSTKCKQSIREIVSGKILKKYRMVHTMNQATGIGRNSLHKSTCKDVKGRDKTRLRAQVNAKIEQVKSFLERDDNSRMMPGKNDAVRIKTKSAVPVESSHSGDNSAVNTCSTTKTSASPSPKVYSPPVTISPKEAPVVASKTLPSPYQTIASPGLAND